MIAYSDINRTTGADYDGTVYVTVTDTWVDYSSLIKYRDDEKFLYEYWKKWNDYCSRQFLRIGLFLKFDPPELLPICKAVMYRKVLRCNRKGIGLRLGKSK